MHLAPPGAASGHREPFHDTQQHPLSLCCSMCCSAHQAMQVDGGEGHLSGELQSHHDHASHPEEQDIMPCLHHGCGVELGQVRGWGVCLGPAQGAEGPQARREPGVQHVLLLAQHNIFAIPAQQALLVCFQYIAPSGCNTIALPCTELIHSLVLCLQSLLVLLGIVGRRIADVMLTAGMQEHMMGVKADCFRRAAAALLPQGSPCMVCFYDTACPCYAVLCCAVLCCAVLCHVMCCAVM